MRKRIFLAFIAAALLVATIVAAGCGSGDTADNGEGVQEGKAQVLLFTTPT